MRRTDRTTTLGALPIAAAAALMLVSTVAVADDTPDPLNNKFRISIGTFGIDSDPEIQLRGQVQEGERVNFDRELGGGDAFRARAEVREPRSGVTG